MNEFLITLGGGVAGDQLTPRVVSPPRRVGVAVQYRLAPIVAAVFGALAILPLTALPLVTITTAMVFGIGAGFGTASAARLVRRADTELRRLLH